MFCKFRLKRPIYIPKMVLGDLPPKFGGINKIPKGTSLCEKTSYDIKIIKISPLDVTKKNKKYKETLRWQTGYLPRTLTLLIKVQFHVVLCFNFHHGTRIGQKLMLSSHSNYTNLATHNSKRHLLV